MRVVCVNVLYMYACASVCIHFVWQDCLKKVEKMVMEDKLEVRFGDWSSQEVEVLNQHLFLTSKPVMYLINLSEKDYIRKKNKW